MTKQSSEHVIILTCEEVEWVSTLLFSLEDEAFFNKKVGRSINKKLMESCPERWHDGS